MKTIFVNLKRFDIPRKLGGICPVEDPGKWIESVIQESVERGLGRLEGVNVYYLLPEALILTAVKTLESYPSEETRTMAIGGQGVFREDIKEGGNFGAFTTNLPAAAARNLGCSWSIIGHSEERADKIGLLEEYEPAIKTDAAMRNKANETVDRIINREVIKALDAGINALLCVGESAEEKGSRDFEEQKFRIKAILKRQLLLGLKGVKDRLNERKVDIGYEPIWAIGPGKTPPGQEYISFVSRFIKETVQENFNFEPVVVYGGGLKEENAEMLSRITTIDGGLVALTRFTGEINFEVLGLKRIIDKYLKGEEN